MNDMKIQLNIYVEFINKIQEILKLQNGDIMNETFRNKIIEKIKKLSLNTTKMYMCRQQFFEIDSKKKMEYIENIGKNKKVKSPRNINREFDNQYFLYPANNFNKKKDVNQKKFEQLIFLSPYKRKHSTKRYFSEDKYNK